MKTAPKQSENVVELKNDKRARFLRHAERRLTVFKRAGRLVENMANQTSYEYTPAEREAVVNVAYDMARRVKSAFERPNREDRDTFKF